MSAHSSNLTHRPLPERPERMDRQIEPAGSHVIVKFSDTVQIPRELYDVSITSPADMTDPEAERAIVLLRQLLDWDQIVNAYGPVSFGRAFASLTWDELEALRGRASAIPRNENETVPPMPMLETYYRFDFAQPRDEIEALLNRLAETLRASDAVESVQVGGEIDAPPQTNVKYEGVFSIATAGGIGIKAIQDDPRYKGKGADGRNAWFVDVEQGWLYLHPELPALPGPVPISGTSRDWIWSATLQDWYRVDLHGQMVLGLIVAKNNNTGVTGIAPAATPFLASEWKKKLYGPYIPNTANAIIDATKLLEAGDVILIEGQQRYSAVGNLPSEADIDILAAIVTAYNLDITVIEPVGNNSPNGLDLDTVVLANRPDLFTTDSGAIWVAAGSNNLDDVTFTRRKQSNHGSKVHCFADGDELWVLDPPGADGDDPGAYFLELHGGTSTAAAIIAGVALMLQGIARYNGGIIRPGTMRKLLSRKKTGTAATPSSTNLGIGVMPDLVKMDKEYTSLTHLYTLS